MADSKPRNSFFSCFGCGLAGPARNESDAPDAKRQHAAPTSPAYGQQAGSPSGAGISPRADAGGRRVSSLTVQLPPACFAVEVTPRKGDADNAIAVSPAANNLRDPALPSPPSNGSAFTEVFHPRRHPRKPKIRTSRVSPAHGTSDELSAATLSPSSSATSLPQEDDVAAALRPDREGDEEDGHYDDDAGDDSGTALAAQQAAQSMEAGEQQQQHPGMVSVTSFHKSVSGGSSSARTSSATSRVADGGQGGADAACSDVVSELEPCPIFIRRGASCSGADPPAGFGGPGSPSATVAPAAARRSSFAGDSSTSLVGTGTVSPPMNQLQQQQPQQLRTSSSLRPSPISPQLQEPQLLQPSASQRLTPPATLLPSASLRLSPLSPPRILLTSPSLRPSPLLPSPSLSRHPPLSPLQQQQPGDQQGGDLLLRLPPPQPPLFHSVCSFGRTGGPSAPPTLPRAGALTPIPHASEHAAALNRLASLQMAHRQRHQEQQGEQATQPHDASAVVRAPAATSSNKQQPQQQQQPTQPHLGLAAAAVASPPEDADAEVGDADSVVGDLPPPPPQTWLQTAPSAALAVEPVRRTASLEQPRPSPDGELQPTAALSDVGDLTTGGAGCEPSLSSHAAKWLEELLPPVPSPKGLGLEARPSNTGAALGGALGAPAAAKSAKAVAQPAAADSFKCLLREIE